MANEMRSNDMELSQAVARLRDLFDAYGAETTRWPAHGRTLYAAHAGDPDVAAMAAEALAFERLMSLRAPAADSARLRALAERIVAAAGAYEDLDAFDSNVYEFTSLHAASSPRITMATRRAGHAALAASLLLGVLVGTSGAGTHAISYLADQSGQSAEEAEVASSSVFVPAFDEVL